MYTNIVYMSKYIYVYLHPRIYVCLHLLAIKSTYLNELYCDRRFSDTTRTNNNEFICLRVTLFVTGFRHFSCNCRDM